MECPGAAYRSLHLTKRPDPANLPNPSGEVTFDAGGELIPYFRADGVAAAGERKWGAPIDTLKEKGT